MPLTHSKVMLTAYKKYRDCLGSLVAAQSAFASSLHEFYVEGGNGEIEKAAGAHQERIVFHVPTALHHPSRQACLSRGSQTC